MNFRILGRIFILLQMKVGEINLIVYWKEIFTIVFVGMLSFLIMII